MGLVRPTSDIASFPAPGWTTSPLFSDVDDVVPDDLTFIVAPVPAAEDPQVALELGDLQIPYGSSGRIEVRVRMRWSEVLTVIPDTVRIGLADAADLTIDNPDLLFERDLVGTAITDLDTTEFVILEIAFNYEDFSGTASAFGIYIEMTPNSADSTAVGHISWIEVLSCVPAVLVNSCSLGSLTAADVITRARDEHVSFEPRKHTNATLLRILSNYQRDLAAKIARVNASVCAVEIQVTLPLDDFNAGVLLPAYTYMLPNISLRSAANPDSQVPMDLVSGTLRTANDMPGRFAYLNGNKLFLGRRPEVYNQFDLLILQAVLTPKNLVSLNDTLSLPDYGVDAYVGHLVAKMAGRGVADLPGKILEGTSAESDFLTTIAQQKAAHASTTRDVWPG